MRVATIAMACAMAVVAAVAALPSASGSTPARASGNHGQPGPTKADVAALRRATAPFHDVEVARRAGYKDDGAPCAESPNGAMGYHYVNQQLASDGKIDALHPEVLLYEKRGNRLQLNGVEYFRPDADGKLDTDDDRPSVFGLTFEGPMEGHTPEMPVHYDLHAWVWKSNPRGMFSQWNPRVHC
jgi:hypothetical protein